MGAAQPRSGSNVWAFVLPVGAVVYAAVATLPIDPWLSALIQAVIYLAFPVAAAYMAARAYRYAGSTDQRAWLLIAISTSAMAVGEIYWAGYQLLVDLSGPPGASPADIAFLLGYTVMAGFVFLLLWDRFGAASVYDRARYTIDALIAITLAASVLVVWIFQPIGAGGAKELTDYAYTLYSLLDIVIVVGMGIVMMASERPAWKRWEMRVAVGLVLMAIGDLVFNVFVAAGTYGPGDLPSAALDVTWMGAYFMFAAAAAAFINSEHALVPHRAPRTRLLTWTDFVPGFVALIFIPTFMYGAVTSVNGGGRFWLWVGAATWLALLVTARSAVLTVANRQLASQSVTDPLTGVYNHRHFHEQLELAIERAGRSVSQLTVMLIDLDNFREINETHGHLAGDRRLKTVADSITAAIRATDLPCRIGGDEFGVILPDADSVDAFKVSMRVMAALIEQQHGEEMPTTASFGIATYPDHALDKHFLLQSADTALYLAKDGGRDRTVIFDSSIEVEDASLQRFKLLEQESLLNTVSALAAAVDARDAYTHSHSRNVSEMAQVIGQRLGFEEARLALLTAAALLHDVGKIGVPDSILGKMGALDEAEYTVVKEHPVLGERIMRSAVAEEVLPWVRHHHERWDGSGYPDGLAGGRIPLEARVIAVCDAFDAMTSDRPYRPAMSYGDALAIVEKEAGRQFDPTIARVFVKAARGFEVEDGKLVKPAPAEKGA